VKRTCALVLLLSLVAIVALACGVGPQASTPDTQATVDAAVAATSTAQAGLQQTVDAAVAATSTAQATARPTATATAQATSAPEPTTTPPPDYTEMSEEDLAALADEAVSDATAATEACSAATTEAAADATVTAEEVAELLALLDEAEQAIAYADELLAAYEDLYGELATLTAATLQAMDEDLVALAEEMIALATTLEEIDTALQQGLAVAEQTIQQLQAVAQAAATQAAGLQAKAQEWVQQLPAEWESRAAAVLAVQPDSVPTDRRTAIRTALDYVDAVRQSLVDKRLSSAELNAIAQLGANASAGLQAHGGTQLQALSTTINDITAMLARGRVPQALAGLGSLETSLPRP